MGPRRRRRATALLVVLALAATGCSGGGDDPAAEPARTSGQLSEPTPSDPAEPAEEPAAGASEEPGPEPSTAPGADPIEADPPPPVSLAAYYREARDYDGGGLRLGAVRERTEAYTSYDTTYRSGDLTISGVLNVPSGRGPFPAVVLAHGYIDPDVYVRGQGMTRERGVLASRGYVALHVDYRAHAESGGTEEQAERAVRLGYVADVVNAARALRRSAEVPVDDDRVALFGRSMGGGVALRTLAAVPGAFDAAVAWASVSSREDDNYLQFTAPDRDEVASFIQREYGAPGTPRGREFWPRVSARPAFDRVTEPVLMVHGRFDDTCPPQWARDSQRALRAAGVDSTLSFYDDGHAFGPAFLPAMDETIDFLEQQLGS